MQMTSRADRFGFYRHPERCEMTRVEREQSDVSELYERMSRCVRSTTRFDPRWSVRDPPLRPQIPHFHRLASLVIWAMASQSKRLDSGTDWV